MKLPQLNLTLKIGRPTNPLAFVRAAALLIAVAATAWIAAVLWRTVVGELIAPRPVDPSQITARQEKVNRRLLETIEARDKKKKSVETPSLPRDPFGE